jgi:hypothetical protein
MLPQIDTMIGFAVVMLLFSLLITILVQIAVTVLDLRGRNLLWGVTVLLEHALPALKARAPDLAKKVLRHSTLTLGMKLNATAIRSDELIRILDHLAASDAPLKQQIDGARAAVKQMDTTGPIQAAFEETFPGDKDKVAAVMSRVRAKALEDMGELKSWYDTVMDRTSERFATWTRLCTALLAVLIAFGLPVDSIAIFKRISTNADLRARLAQSADATIRMADDVSRDEGVARHLAADALDTTKRGHPEVTATVDRDLGTRAQGSHWILAHVPVEAREGFSRDYESEYDKALSPLAKDLVTSATAVKAQLLETQLTFIAPRSRPSWESFLGMLISTLFLSLGAPFWYNVLQQVGNLRPILAGKVDDAEAKKGASPRA